jgi:hypothetical protein
MSEDGRKMIQKLREKMQAIDDKHEHTAALLDLRAYFYDSTTPFTMQLVPMVVNARTVFTGCLLIF